jgi:hypothetical protein
MERSLADDLRLALAFLIGAVIAWLLLGADDALGVLLGAVGGTVIAIVVLNVVRHVRQQRKA